MICVAITVEEQKQVANKILIDLAKASLRLLEKVNKKKHFKIICFIREMSDRLLQGEYRYGPGNASQKYLTRLEIELKSYKQTGNAEQLYNIANYCLLESLFPENGKFHYNKEVDSVTRSIMEKQNATKTGPIN